VSEHPFGWEAPAKILVPRVSPMRGRRQPALVDVPPAPEGMVWVLVQWEGAYGSERIEWEWRPGPRLLESAARRLRLVPVETLARWDAAREAFSAIEAEAEAVMKSEPPS
jgi:hypothetical protein